MEHLEQLSQLSTSLGQALRLSLLLLFSLLLREKVFHLFHLFHFGFVSAGQAGGGLGGTLVEEVEDRYVWVWRTHTFV